MGGIKRTSHAVYDTKYHLVWTPKYRKWILRGDIRERVRELFEEIATNHEFEIDKMEVGSAIDLIKINKLVKNKPEILRVYPGSMEIRANKIFSLRSRAVAVVGIGNSISEAREASLEGLDAIKGGELWNRIDIAEKKHVQKSMEHMRNLRRR